ncbi:MAG: hypothetical protein FWE28_03585 [Oscillospiraceae bacterium]|nr:hypothetical protein [Oscillospiraceae bacterium]
MREELPLKERLARGFWVVRRVVVVNLLIFPVLWPVFSWFYLIINSYFYAFYGDGMVEMLPGFGLFGGLLLQLPPVIFYVLFGLSAILAGPFVLGLHYALGNFVAGRHMWVSDVFQGVKDNFRQGMVLGVFTVVAVHLLLWNIFGGIVADGAWFSVWLMVSRWASVVLLAALFMTLPFVCQIAVTVRQPLFTVIKNGVILARVYIGRGLLVLLGTALYWAGTTILAPGLNLVMLPLFSVGLTVLWQAMVCRPVVQTRLIAPMEQQTNPEIFETDTP